MIDPLQGGTPAEPNPALRRSVRGTVRGAAPLFNTMVPLHLRDLSHSSHPADVARRRRQRAKERAALVPEPPPTPNAYPRAARGSAILSTAHGPSFYIAPRYRPPLDPESVHYHYHRPEPNTEPYYDWPACQCTDPDAQERIRAFGRWVRDQHFPITEPLSRTHFPIPPPSINAPAACYCLHPGLFNYDSNPWPQPDMNPQPDPNPAATTRDDPQPPPVSQASLPAGGEGFQPRPSEPNPVSCSPGARDGSSRVLPSEAHPIDSNSADPNPAVPAASHPVNPVNPVLLNPAAPNPAVRSTGQIPEGHLQSTDGQDLGPFPKFPPHTPIHRLPINFQRVVQDWFDKNVPLDEMAYLLDYHFHFVTSPSAISRYHTRLRQETAHREAAVLVQVVRELADEQVLGSKPDTAAAREELCTLKEIQALDRDDIHAYVALRRLRLDEREAVVHERLAAVRERQIALDERLAELRLHPASAPALKIPEGSQAGSRWEAQRAHRSNPPSNSNRTPKGCADPTPAASSPGSSPADSGATTTTAESNPADRRSARRSRTAPNVSHPVNPVHPVLPHHSPAAISRDHPPTRPVLNVQPVPNPAPDAASDASLDPRRLPEDAFAPCASRFTSCPAPAMPC